MKYSSKIYLKLITKDNNCHNKNNSIIAAFVYDFETQRKYYYNFIHGDVVPDLTFVEFKSEIESGKYTVYVNNKKTYKYWLNCKLVDVNLFGFIKNNETLEECSSATKDYLNRSHRNVNDFNLIVPYISHQECFDDEVELICDLHEVDTDTYCFKYFNDIITDTLYDVEKN